MTVMTIALAQLRGTLYDKKSNVNRIITTLQTCKEKAVDYILFPEMFLTGYHVFDRLEELAEPLDGPCIENIRKQAEAAGVGVVFGFPERSGDLVYNAAVFIEKTGEIGGVYRKVHLFDIEKELFHPGDELPVFDSPFGKIGMMMTFDMAFPEITRIYALQDAALVFGLHSHVVPYQSYQEILLRSRALENQLFIAAVNKVGLEETTLFFGESAVISPEGVYLHKSSNNEEVSVVSIDLAEVQRIRTEKPMKYLTNLRPGLYRRYDSP